MTNTELQIGNIDIRSFQDKQKELDTLYNTFKGLNIKGKEDKAGYKQVDRARKTLKKTRSEISNKRKELGSILTQAGKTLIKMEKEALEKIQPLEIELQKKQKKIDEMIEMDERKHLLPERKNKLYEIDVEELDEELLKMNDDEFIRYYNIKKEQYLEEKERKIKEQQEAMERAKREEEEKQKEAEREKIRKEEEKRRQYVEGRKEKMWEILKKCDETKIDLEQKDFEKYLIEEKEKIEEEKQKETERIKKQAEKETREKLELERLRKKEKQEQEEIKALNDKKYIDFLKDCGITSENKHKFKIITNQETGKKEVYKLIAIYE